MLLMPQNPAVASVECRMTHTSIFSLKRCQLFIKLNLQSPKSTPITQSLWGLTTPGNSRPRSLAHLNALPDQTVFSKSLTSYN